MGLPLQVLNVGVPSFRLGVVMTAQLFLRLCLSFLIFVLFCQSYLEQSNFGTLPVEWVAKIHFACSFLAQPTFMAVVGKICSMVNCSVVLAVAYWLGKGFVFLACPMTSGDACGFLLVPVDLLSTACRVFFS